MKLYDVCIRGFVKGNLGDDLFIDILCRRYPNTKFVICGGKEYKNCFSEIPNLKYVSSDAMLIKMLFRMIKLPIWCINKLALKFGKREQLSYFGCQQFLQLLSRENVLISGSLFMELGTDNFVIGPYQVGEKNYYKKHPYIIGCNFGPYHNEEYKKFYQDCFKNAKWVCFREKYSYDLFEGENIHWGTDIVFSYSKDRIILPAEKDYIVISVLDLNKDTGGESEKAKKYIQTITNTVKEFLERGEHVVLAGFCNAQGDDKLNNEIYEKCGRDKNLTICNYPSLNYREMLGIIAGAKSIISTRYHGMILGWLFGKRILPIVYSSKMQHVIDDTNLKIISCNLSEENFSCDILLDAYDRMMAEPYQMNIEDLIRNSQIHFELLDKHFT